MVQYILTYVIVNILIVTSYFCFGFLLIGVVGKNTLKENCCTTTSCNT